VLGYRMTSQWRRGRTVPREHLPLPRDHDRRRSGRCRSSRRSRGLLLDLRGARRDRRHHMVSRGSRRRTSSRGSTSRWPAVTCGSWSPRGDGGRPRDGRARRRPRLLQALREAADPQKTKGRHRGARPSRIGARGAYGAALWERSGAEARARGIAFPPGPRRERPSAARRRALPPGKGRARDRRRRRDRRRGHRAALESGARVACLDRPGSRQIEVRRRSRAISATRARSKRRSRASTRPLGRLDILVHAAGSPATVSSGSSRTTTGPTSCGSTSTPPSTSCAPPPRGCGVRR